MEKIQNRKHNRCIFFYGWKGREYTEEENPIHEEAALRPYSCIIG